MTAGRSDDVRDETRELFETAMRGGYFILPRETTLPELADVRDTTDRAASKRLRFGIDALLRERLNDRDTHWNGADTPEKTDGHDDH